MTHQTLEDRLRDHYRNAADKLTLRDVSFDDLILPAPQMAHPQVPRGRVMLGVAAAMVVAIGAGVVFVSRSRPVSVTPVTAVQGTVAETQPSDSAQPAVTEPPVPDSGVTVTTMDANAPEHRPETVPYVLDLPGSTNPTDGASYVDPSTSAVGRTFVSPDAQLTRVFVVLTYPLDAAQPPQPFTGQVIDVPTGEAHFSSTRVEGQSMLEWKLADHELVVSSLGMSAADTVAAAIEFEQTQTVTGLRLDGIWGNDRTETVRQYFAADTGTQTVVPETTDARGIRSSDVPSLLGSLEMTWRPPIQTFPGEAAAERTTVLGLPAWKWRIARGDPKAPTTVMWQIPGTERWMQLEAPADRFDAALAALRPVAMTATNPAVGFLSIPSMDGGAFITDGVAGQQLDELSHSDGVHDISTALPQDAGATASLVFVSSNQFGRLETLVAGTEIDWTPAGTQPAITFLVTSVHSYDINTDPLTTSKAGLVIVTDTENPGSGRQIVVTATRSDAPPSTTG